MRWQGLGFWKRVWQKCNLERCSVFINGQMHDYVRLPIVFEGYYFFFHTEFTENTEVLTLK